jgi:hypothetical protein
LHLQRGLVVLLGVWAAALLALEQAAWASWAPVVGQLVLAASERQTRLLEPAAFPWSVPLVVHCHLPGLAALERYSQASVRERVPLVERSEPGRLLIRAGLQQAVCDDRAPRSAWPSPPLTQREPKGAAVACAGNALPPLPYARSA